jgi:hypothetical protein
LNRQKPQFGIKVVNFRNRLVNISGCLALAGVVAAALPAFASGGDAKESPPPKLSIAAASDLNSFGHTLGEFGVVLMIGGDLAGVTRTISISIFDQVQALDYGAASQTALALLLFSFLVLAITYGLQRRVIAVWPPR